MTEPLAPTTASLSRLRAIAGVMARHGFAPAMRRMPLVRAFVTDDDTAPHKQPVAERFASMLEELGPTFVKLGQVLSTRADLLPADFIRVLERLQDQVPPVPFADVRAQIVRELGCPIESVFRAVDETPLASASVAQVHAATLHTGEDVVIKVQRPGVAEQIRQDASMLVVLAQLLELVVKEASTYRAADFVREFQEGLQLEIDFSREARNLAAFAHNNVGRPGMHVPRVYLACSGKTLLTMERIRGRRITDLAGEPEKARAIIERLVSVAFDHVFVDGLFHGDPHPGNVMVTDDGDLAFIDFGLVGRVARETQDRLLMLLLALSLRDADTLARLVVRMGEAEGRVELSALRKDIDTLLDRYVGLSVADVNSASVLTDLFELSSRYGVRLPREFALLGKASVSIEGIVRKLHPGFDPTAVLSTRAEELLLERLDPRKLKGGGLRTALQVGMLVNELPVQLGQLMMDLERGNLQMSVHSSDLDAVGRLVRGLGMTIFGGALAAACVIGGIDALAHAPPPWLSSTVLALCAFIAAGMLLGIAFAWYVTGGRMPKIAIGRMLGGRLRSWSSSTSAQGVAPIAAERGDARDAESTK